MVIAAIIGPIICFVNFCCLSSRAQRPQVMPCRANTHAHNHDNRKHAHTSRASAEAERDRMQEKHPSDTFNAYLGEGDYWYVGRSKYQ